MAWAESFSAMVDNSTQVLVLGSMPGVKSLAEAQYYAHPRNAFWPIMQALFSIPIDIDYEERVSLLNSHNVGLWDVYARCFRRGSLDADIDQSTAHINDFSQLFTCCPNIHSVFCNGKAAEATFRKQVLSTLDGKPIQCFGLTSTSPANAKLTFEQKLQQWGQIKEVIY